MIPKILKTSFGKIAILVLAIGILSIQLYEAGRKSQKMAVEDLEETVKKQTATIAVQSKIIENLAKK